MFFPELLLFAKCTFDFWFYDVKHGNRGYGLKKINTLYINIARLKHWDYVCYRSTETDLQFLGSQHFD
jgi:hypothetical protein